VEIVAASGEASVLGESPLWSPNEGRLYWVDITARKLNGLDVSTGATSSREMPSEIGAIGLRAGGGLIGALRSGFHPVSIEGGCLAALADPEPGLPGNRLNDGKTDRRGRFWAGSLQDPGYAPVGRLYRLEAGGRCEALLEGIAIPNSIAWSPDDATMYFADSLSGEICAFDFDAGAGEISNRRVFARVPAADGVPDGSTVDADGFLWNAHMDGWRITRYSPDGRVDRVIRLPVQRVTSIAFGGPRLDTLYVTTATRRLTPEQIRAQPLAGRLLAIQGLGARGLPEPEFAG